MPPARPLSMATMTDEKARTELNTVCDASAKLSKGILTPGGGTPNPRPAAAVAYGASLALSLWMLYQTRTARGFSSHLLIRFSVASPNKWKSRLYQAFMTALGSAVTMTTKLTSQGCGANGAPAAVAISERRVRTKSSVSRDNPTTR